MGSYGLVVDAFFLSAKGSLFKSKCSNFTVNDIWLENAQIKYKVFSFNFISSTACKEH